MDHRLFVQKLGNDVSPWHDIPMQNPDGTLNFVCEIPKNTSAKLEVATVRTPAQKSPRAISSPTLLSHSFFLPNSRTRQLYHVPAILVLRALVATCAVFNTYTSFCKLEQLMIVS